ncbi:ABC transporter ATP-binding protein [Rhizobium lentis]|uniref:ABC transporter ATP-binding protein n=1 Tax=Rhizobium lentis TaxID=1138194 RepID=UPI001C82CBFB|nr:sn-glycerol-3-phosphate ABC transporter ATP-binding protein UgpC [Rhizobium lentis]MBX5048680.1 sn-glycerol-3-phosphate ABC transporter ATP-binding protein UgpC [Rhizobium lentis]MBX5060405.1 sn-glycerol-3-phosphate ABC transporter ATP-binding protein UgpC [Rhizobium lentis]
MAEVNISEARKAYGALNILHGVDIDIRDGEFVVLVGPSGCGKSTLLRMVAGLESITGGTISIGGKIVNNLPPKDRDIAMVFQSYALYPHKTVAENMVFALRLQKQPTEVIKQRLQAAAETLDLVPYLDRYPRQLSGGQRQRVAMGRAIVRSPQVFLFDEPLSNLDAKLRVQMRKEIKELHQRLRTTTIYVTHDQVEAMTMADKIVVMQGGKIEQTGTPLELYDRPRNTFVATFIGSPSMNLLKGRYKADGAVFVTETGDEIALGFTPEASDGQAVRLGVRPEHLSLAASGLTTTVNVTEPTGHETTVFLRYGSGELVAVLSERHGFEPGQVVTIAARPGKLHLFDAESGKTLRRD